MESTHRSHKWHVRVQTASPAEVSASGSSWGLRWILSGTSLPSSLASGACEMTAGLDLGLKSLASSGAHGVC